MNTPVRYRRLISALLLAGGWLGSAAASDGAGPTQQAGATPVAAAPTAMPLEAADLKFHEFFKLPVGPRGLEPAEKIKSLAGQRVRMVGYMVRQNAPESGFFVLSPLPVSLGDEDESLADDLPASVVFVHLGIPADQPLPFYPGLLRVSGTLSVGAYEEADGHVSSVRLQLDPELVQALAAGHRH